MGLGGGETLPSEGIMCKSKTAEEWAQRCGRTGHPNSWKDAPNREVEYLALCIDCATAYARQVGEAVREKAAQLVECEYCEEGTPHEEWACQSGGALRIRNLSVELA